MAKKNDAPIEYQLDPSQWLEWEYSRPNGDIICFAPTREDAVRVMAEHGFPGIKPEKLVLRDRLLSDLLTATPIL